MTRFALVTASFVIVSSSVSAASATWNVAGDGNWATDGNWTPGAAPGNTSGTTSPDIAIFGSPTATRIISADTNRNIGGITFSGAGAFNTTISGGSLLLTSGGLIQNTGATGNRTDKIDSAVIIQGDGGTYTLGANSTNNSSALQIGTGGITGVSTAGNTTVLTLNGGNASANNSISGVIGNGSAGGNLAVVKNGTGFWNLSGANTYSGGFTLNAGGVRISNNAAFGTGTLTINGGSLSGSANATIANNMVWNATVSHTNAIGNSGNIVMNGNALLTGSRDVSVTASNSSLTVSGVISDGGSGYGINKTGVFNLTLGGANTYTGTTNINAGTVTLGAAGGFSSDSILSVNAGVAAGVAGGRLDLKGRSQTVAGLTSTGGLGGQGVISNTSGTAVTLTVNGSGDTTYGGLIVEAGAGNVSLAKSGDGTLTLTGSHNYAGGTTVSGGTLIVNGGATMVAATSSTQGTITPSFGNFTMTGLASTSGLVVGQRISGTNIPANAYITSIVSGTSITFSAHTNNANTATDTESFAAYNGSGLGTGAVTVSGGILGGTGVIAGATTIQAGGTLAAGVDGVGTLTFGGSLTLAGTTLLEIAGSSSHDVVAVGGAVHYGGTLTVNLINGFAFADGQTFDLFTSSSHTGEFALISVAGVLLDADNGYSATVGGFTYTFANSDNIGQLSVMDSAIPEPSAYAAVLGGLAIAASAMRRRRG